MAGLLPAALLAGEGGYYLTALFSAVAVLKRLAPEPAPDKSAPVSSVFRTDDRPTLLDVAKGDVYFFTALPESVSGTQGPVDNRYS